MIRIDKKDKKQDVSSRLKKQALLLEHTFGKDTFNFRDFYFAGGCIYSLWNDREPKDYDVFCRNKKAMKKLRRYFCKHKDKADIITRNAISMGKFQFITRHIGEPRQEVAKFDFLHNCYWYDSDGLHDLKGWEYLDSNKLQFNSTRARDVLNIITRIPKFVGRGMAISQSEILDILEVGTRPTKVFSERRNIKQRQRGRTTY